MLYIPHVTPSQRLMIEHHRHRLLKYKKPNIVDNLVIDECPAPIQSRAAMHIKKHDPSSPKNRVNQIMRFVASFHSRTVDEIKSPSRIQPLVRARHDAMFVAKIITNRSLPEIGRRFGNRDHTTVLNAIKKTERRIASDFSARSEIGELIEHALKEF